MFTTQQFQYFSVFFLFALFSDGPEVFLPKYSEKAICHAAHFWRVVKAQKRSEPHSVSIFGNRSRSLSS